MNKYEIEIPNVHSFEQIILNTEKAQKMTLSNMEKKSIVLLKLVHKGKIGLLRILYNVLRKKK